MVIAVCGKPGSGKTLFTTYLLKKKFKQENNIFVRLFKKQQIFNNCFSNYPIELYKNVYSNKISLLDLTEFHKWKMDSDIVFDEVQAYFDSTEYKSIPKTIANNFQFHRHFGIHNIYIVSQDLSRIPKVLRILAEEYIQIKKFVRIPFLRIAIFNYVVWFREEDYGKCVDLTREQKKHIDYEYKKKILFFRYPKVFKSYDTKYLKALVEDSEYLHSLEFDSLYYKKSDVVSAFPRIKSD